MRDASTLIRLEADERAPRLAREWLSRQASLDRVRRAQAELLVSELVTGAVVTVTGDPAAIVTITAEMGPFSLLVAVEAPEGCSFLPAPDTFPSMLLDGFAQNWGRGPTDQRIWFEVPLPGAVDRGTSWLPTNELLQCGPEARDELIARFTPMATRLARRYQGKGVSDDDVRQAALFGLFQALRRYDQSKGPFEPYATLTITGELKRLLRDRGWSLTVPRQLKDRALEVGRVEQSLSQMLGRPAAPAEIAEHLGIGEEEVLEARACASAYNTGSLDAPVGELEMAPLDPPDSTADPGADWARHTVGDALSLVSEQERRLLHMRFYEDKTQSEIAQVLGLSQMHVSRLLGRTLNRLQVLLDDSQV